MVNKDRKIVQNLQKGDEIRFKGKFVTLGGEFKMHHLRALEIIKTGIRKEIDEIIVRESTLLP